MKRYLTWFLIPLLLGMGAGLVSAVGSADACSPVRVFWVLERAEPQPDDAPVDTAVWPSAGQLGPHSIALQEGEAWLRIEY